MNATEKAIVVGLGLVVAVGLFAGTAFGLVGQTPATSHQRGGGMMSGGSSYGGSGMMGLGTNGATSTESHAGGIMGGMWGMMGEQGPVTNGGNLFMGCIQYMAHYFGIGSNGTAS